MTTELTARELRDLADAVDAANAIAAVRIEWLDEPAELPRPPESEPMVMHGVRLPVSLEKQVRAATQTGHTA